jgi:hypothetical protein
MRTRTVALLIVASALLAPASAGAKGPASVKVTQCRTGDDAVDRAVTYRARMRSVPGSARMRLRFVLLARSTGDSPQQLGSENIGGWRKSDAGVTRFSYSQKVRGLDAGVAYRAVVKFRWYDANGKLIKRAKRRSRACKPSGELPNLELLSVKVSPGKTPGTARYSINIGNTGEGPAEFFVVSLFVNNDAEVDSRTIERMEAGETETIKFNGPACFKLRAVVDRERSVPETIEDDNVLSARC